jgi:hypothetical protein
MARAPMLLYSLNFQYIIDNLLLRILLLNCKLRDIE